MRQYNDGITHMDSSIAHLKTLSLPAFDEIFETDHSTVSTNDEKVRYVIVKRIYLHL